ncbi:MAG: D-glycero-beta-D-manno-heptose 1-phosphate adenylyltransferase, partial [Alcaligenaceae bacterium]|nr:D-glycero-beta-D-manno-heptose 1-phosphate adenylyltransferase [Alcaligenaceae bacterium]
MNIRFEDKILSVEDCLALLESGAIKRPLVFTNGVFDI